MLKREIPMAMKSLAITLARERLRYAYTRGGTYKLKPKQYGVGDFMYVNRFTLGQTFSGVPLLVLATQFKSELRVVMVVVA